MELDAPETTWTYPDAALDEELAAKRTRRTLPAGLIAQLKAEQAARAERARKDHRAIQNAQRDADHSFKRPVLMIEGDAVQEPESEVWRHRLAARQAEIKASLPSIGRIDLKNHDHMPWAGTGWYVADDILVTNRHVALTLALGGPPYPLRLNGAGSPIAGALDTGHEHRRPEPRAAEILRALWIAPDDNVAPDVAFLQVAPGSGAPRLLLRDKPAQVGEWIAAVGYPGRDGARNDEDEMDAMFAGIYSVKRLSPGAVIGATTDRFFHDCTTLGGNSGSAIFDLASGEVLGLHFGGAYKRRNFAVHAFQVRELLEEHVTRGAQ
ncbi:MAG: serine protease [Nannocystaceae bacterium]